MSHAAFADELLQLIAEEDPLNDALQGYPGLNDRLPDLDEAAQERLKDRALAVGREAARLAPSPEEWITAAVTVQQAQALADRVDARLVEHTMVDYQASPIGRLLGALPLVRPATEEGERGFLERLAGAPRFLEAAARRHRRGLAAGRVPVKERVRTAIARLDRYLANPAGDPLLAPPLSPGHAAERERLLAGSVRPALALYRSVLESDIEPLGRPPERPGLCWLPYGAGVYRGLVRMHTTTDLTPDQLHLTGLTLVEGLAQEYLDLGAIALGETSAAAVMERLRSDGALRWGSGEELLSAARAAIARAEARAPEWFSCLPEGRCAVERAPEADAPNAYYLPPALDASRPGTYFANLHRATERHRFLAEVTAFHEAVPGHHLQLALAQGLPGLPRLRRYAWINAYIEGWGLYAERLADEMGLYSGHMARLGMLAMDSIRAARLVVDTGLHAFGWGRQQAVDYLRHHTLMADAELQRETDRYIEMPGQALSYMVGRLEIQRLRARARRELGPGFEARAFHDALLGSGALPMAVLDQVLADWTRSRSDVEVRKPPAVAGRRPHTGLARG